MPKTPQQPKKNLSAPAVAILITTCVLLSTLAVTLTPATVQNTPTLVYSINTPLQIITAAISIYLFRRLFWCAHFDKTTTQNISGTQTVTAALLAILTTAGTLLNTTNTLIPSCLMLNQIKIISPAAISAALLLMVLGFFLLYYAIIDWLFAKVEQFLSRPKCPNQHPITILGHPLTAPLCAAILLLAWLPYIVYFFPLTVTTDTSRHLAQLLGSLDLTTHFPFLPGLIQSALFRAGTVLDPTGTLGTFLMGVPQILLGLFVFTQITLQLSRRTPPLPRWLTYATLVFSALFPLIPIYIVQIGKDTLHAELVALFALQVFLFCQANNAANSTNATNAAQPTSQLATNFTSTAQPAAQPITQPITQPTTQHSHLYSPWAIALVGLLVALTRNNGILIVLVALIICLAIYRSKLLAASTLVLCACFCLWQFALIPTCGIKSAGYTEMCSMPAQVVAACIKDGAQLTPEEQTQLQGYFTEDLAKVVSKYTPDFADPVKASLQLPTAQDVAQFTKMAITLAQQKPIAAISAALNTTYGMWYPFCRGTYHSEDTPYIIDAPGGWAQIEQWHPNIEQLPALHASKLKGMQAVAVLHYIPILSLLYTPGVYLWFFILTMGFVLKSKKYYKLPKKDNQLVKEGSALSKKDNMGAISAPTGSNTATTIAVLSIFLTLWVIMIFGPCASIRYTIPAVFSLPIMVAAVLGIPAPSTEVTHEI